MTQSLDGSPQGTRVASGTRSDAELIAELQAPDGRALEEVIRRYGRLVFRVAADILRDAGEAEDVTQEVFLEIYRKAHLYDAARGTVRVWLLQYAYHRTLRRKATLRRRAAYRGEPIETFEAVAEDRRRLLTREECRWVIRAGLVHLPERQRATLELACFEDLSLRDVADRLSVSLGCARHYYYRGLARLRRWALLGGIDPAKAAPTPAAARRSRRAIGRHERETEAEAGVEVGGV